MRKDFVNEVARTQNVKLVVASALVKDGFRPTPEGKFQRFLCKDWRLSVFFLIMTTMSFSLFMLRILVVYVWQQIGYIDKNISKI